MEYHEIRPDMTIGDLVLSGVYGVFAEYLFTYMTPDHWNRPLREYGFEKCGFEQGLRRMEELAAADGKGGRSFLHPIYPREERLREWDKADAEYLYFPPCGARADSAPKPYVIVIPGGGFNRQWGFIEGESIAAALNAMGYPAFVLFYRVKQEPLMPRPLEDLYRMMADLEARAAEFHILPGRCMIGGFSAGGTLAAEAGSANLGWKAAGVSRPEALFLGYPAVRPSASWQAWQQAPEHSALREAMGPFLRRLGGPDFTEASLEPFELLCHLDDSCPPVYLTACEDDGTVPVQDSIQLDARLTELGIPHRTRIGRRGGHSFGLGVGTDTEGWLAEAVAFWREQAE